MTVSKYGTVGEAKEALLCLIGEQLSRDLVVLAEVKEKSIVRVVVSQLCVITNILYLHCVYNIVGR